MVIININNLIYINYFYFKIYNNLVYKRVDKH